MFIHNIENIHMEKVRGHPLCYEGKLWTFIFLQSKYVLTKLFNLSKSVVSKVVLVRKLRKSSTYCLFTVAIWDTEVEFLILGPH